MIRRGFGWAAQEQARSSVFEQERGRICRVKHNKPTQVYAALLGLRIPVRGSSVSTGLPRVSLHVASGRLRLRSR